MSYNPRICQRSVFLLSIRLLCKGLLKETKSVSKLSVEEVDLFFLEGIDIQSLSSLIDNDITEVKDYIRTILVSKSGTKSKGKGTKSRISGTKTLAIIDMLAFGLKSRVELLTGISLYNRTGNFNNWDVTLFKPLRQIIFSTNYFFTNSLRNKDSSIQNCFE